MTVPDQIRHKLQTALQPLRLEIMDESFKHRRHAAASPSGGTHFRVLVVADRFTGMPLMDRHKTIYDLLATEMREGIHALSLNTYSPSEWAAKESTSGKP